VLDSAILRAGGDRNALLLTEEDRTRPEGDERSWWKPTEEEGWDPKTQMWCME
jgi:hypothetical protein